jgi:NodT family efflux transporter outer membrane factor (OMF) lipoprotein
MAQAPSIPPRGSSLALRRLVASLLATTMLAGCAVGPDFLRPAQPKAGAYTSTEVGSLPSAGADAVRQRIAMGKEVSAQWWRLFRSPEMNEVLDTVIAGSPTLESGRATLAQAREEITRAAGAFYPQLDVGADASRQKAAANRGGTNPGAITNTFSIGPLVSYGLDIFGGTRRSVEQAQALAEFQRYQLAAAYLTLTGNAVTQVLNIASIRAQIAAIEDIIAVDRRNLDLVRTSFTAGRSALTDVLSAESQLTSDLTQLPPLRQQLSVAQHALSVLAGKSPAEWMPPDFELDRLDLPQELPVTLPSELVHARPDILAAEAQLHAASAAIGVATAQLYPDVTLSSSWSRTAPAIPQLFDPQATIWSIAASLTAPLFHGGSLEAQRRAAIDAFQAQLATYRDTVLQSFGQVADVLRALEHDAELLDAQTTALQTAQTSLQLTQESYSAGQASLLQVLDAQRLFQQARLGYARARAQRYQDTTQLFEAMGGAWSDFKDAAP